MGGDGAQASGGGVDAFLAAIGDERRREDARALAALIERATGEAPAMWGSSIVGFGRYHYRYESGREGDGAPVGFSPRAKELVVYLAVHSERTPELLERLGRHRQGKGCVYIRSLADVDETVLAELIRDAYRAALERYPTR